MIPLQMALEPIIALGIFGTIFSLIGYKALKNYLTIEHQKTTSSERNTYENTILNLKKELVETEGSRRNYKAKLNLLRKDYDIDWGDLELDENEESSKLIPSIAEALFPKLPKSVKEILGKEEIEEGIFKFIEKNPDKLGDWISKIFPKDTTQSSSTPKLQEKYL